MMSITCGALDKRCLCFLPPIPPCHSHVTSIGFNLCTFLLSWDVTPRDAKYSFALQDGTWEFSGDAVAGKGLIL